MLETTHGVFFTQIVVNMNKYGEVGDQLLAGYHGESNHLTALSNGHGSEPDLCVSI